MNVRICTPDGTCRRFRAAQITLETAQGYYTLLQRHVDFVGEVMPGVVTIVEEGGEEILVGLDEGIVVKRGDDVVLSTRAAIGGKRLGELRQVLEEHVRNRTEREKKAKSALAKLEASMARQVYEFEKATPEV